jgi:hypothetical protein
MAIILKASKVNLFVSSVLFVFWYHSRKFLDTPRTTLTKGSHASGGYRTRNLSKREAADPHLRLRGHWNRHRENRMSVNPTL